MNQNKNIEMNAEFVYLSLLPADLQEKRIQTL